LEINIVDYPEEILSTVITRLQDGEQYLVRSAADRAIAAYHTTMPLRTMAAIELGIQISEDDLAVYMATPAVDRIKCTAFVRTDDVIAALP
jgi:hypothetical protein